MGRNGRCGRRCNGARSVSAIAVAVEKSPRPAYSRSPKPASGSSVTCWVTSRKRYAAIAARLLHPLCSDGGSDPRSEEHTSELQSRGHLVCRLLLEKKKYNVDDVALGVCKTGAEEAGVTEVRTSLSEKKFELWREIKVDRKSGSAGMPRPISYAVFCLKKKRKSIQ